MIQKENDQLTRKQTGRKKERLQRDKKESKVNTETKTDELVTEKRRSLLKKGRGKSKSLAFN